MIANINHELTCLSNGHINLIGHHHLEKNWSKANDLVNLHTQNKCCFVHVYFSKAQKFNLEY